MAKNIMKLDTEWLERFMVKIDELGGNVKKVTELTLKKAAIKVQNDTVIAASKPNLPALGRYSGGDTDASIIHFPKVEWEGLSAWVGVGFDWDKPGAGGLLIAGTPKMKPDAKLRKMYKGKSYAASINNEMLEEVWDEMMRLWEG